MGKVVGYIKWHLAQRPHHSVEHTRWRYSLMNWGHDPLKDGRRETVGFISAAGLDAGWGSTITLLCQLAGWPLLGVGVVGRKVVAHSGGRDVRASRKDGPA